MVIKGRYKKGWSDKNDQKATQRERIFGLGGGITNRVRDFSIRLCSNFDFGLEVLIFVFLGFGF